jgi:hypothetical protein
MVFWTYCRSQSKKYGAVTRIIRYGVLLIWALAVVSIIGTKLHYTLDVFLAAFLTFTIWRAFHHAVEFEKLREHYGVLRWIEAESIIEVDERAYEAFVAKNKVD